jgi:Probable zinc-ribbon domain
MSADTSLTRRDCGSSFTFTRSEQRLYASLGFNRPAHCTECRVRDREARMLDLHLESEVESETATKWQRCGGCGGTNAHHATACEFCARILGRAHSASDAAPPHHDVVVSRAARPDAPQRADRHAGRDAGGEMMACAPPSQTPRGS